MNIKQLNREEIIRAYKPGIGMMVLSRLHQVNFKRIANIIYDAHIPIRRGKK